MSIILAILAQNWEATHSFYLFEDLIQIKDNIKGQKKRFSATDCDFYTNSLSFMLKNCKNNQKEPFQKYHACF